MNEQEETVVASLGENLKGVNELLQKVVEFEDETVNAMLDEYECSQIPLKILTQTTNANVEFVPTFQLNDQPVAKWLTDTSTVISIDNTLLFNKAKKRLL